ncbi:MAG: glycoside hydrolase family 2 protein, partial [Thermoproteota archaeon]
MKVVSLDGSWLLKGYDKQKGEEEKAFMPEIEENRWIKANIPGVVHLDLIKNKQIPDPFFGLNELKVSWVEEKDWWYRKKFLVDKELLSYDYIELVFQGLDTFATVWLNGKEIAKFSNMFHEHNINIKNYLKEGENLLVVKFDSPKRVLENEYNKRSVKLGAAFYPPVVYGRKAQYSFGWDWGPRLPTSGIWRSVVIRAYNTCKIESFYFSSSLSNSLDVVNIKVDVSLEAFKEEKVEVLVRIFGFGEDQTKRETKSLTKGLNNLTFDFTIANPKLWWPNGYGDQNLYNLEIKVVNNSGVLDEVKKKVGIRKIEVIQEKDEEGKTFYFKVNNVPIFCKGADWVPADSFLPRVSRERYDYLLSKAKEANMNMIRVWGGGVYEDESFYELCDEKGILIWQDFMFACGEYPEEEWFFDLVREEADKVVKRLRNHACIAIWCGNNENNWGYKAHWFGVKDKFYGETIYHKILPEVCSELDPSTLYWPSSPFGGEDPNSQSEGDRHSWDVWSGLKDYTEYLNDKGRFISEFGFQSLPSLKTILKFTSKEDRFFQSKVIEHHNKQVGGPERLLLFLSMHFRLPSTLERFVYLTQLNQGEALKTGIEHWRRRKFKTGGALIWQLNDCWPVASWSLIDYYNEPKASYYYVKRAFDPLNISLLINGDEVEVWVVNDFLESKSGKIRLLLYNVEGKKISEKKIEVNVKPNSSTLFLKQNLKELGYDKSFIGFVAGVLEVEGSYYRYDVILLEKLKYIE